jgi:GTP-binding protein
MIVADVPGLIEGASEGHGLGFRFLKHLERVRVLCHLIDLSSEESLFKRFEIINHELKNYSSELYGLPQIVAINKIDAASDENLEELVKFEAMLKQQYITSFRISALSGNGVAELKTALYEKIRTLSGLAEGQLEPQKAFDPTANLYK